MDEKRKFYLFVNVGCIRVLGVPMYRAEVIAWYADQKYPDGVWFETELFASKAYPINKAFEWIDEHKLKEGVNYE